MEALASRPEAILGLTVFFGAVQAIETALDIVQ
jgi:hypothetical protein